jgi:hypothetical protein
VIASGAMPLATRPAATAGMGNALARTAADCQG